jgi:primase-polymerase (primpol)-like protein
VNPELREYKQWVLWRKVDMNGRKAKLPISPWSGKAAACDKPQAWSTYHHVRYAMRRHRADGLGLVFTDGDPFCGMDLDRCRDANGIIDAHARNLIARFASYTELSPSGAGVHMPTSVTTARYAHVRDWTASAASAGLLVRRASRRFSHARTGIAIRAPTVIPMPSPLASG